MTVWVKRLEEAIERADDLHAEDVAYPSAEYDPEVDLLRSIIDTNDLLKRLRRYPEEEEWSETIQALARGQKKMKALWKEEYA